MSPFTFPYIRHHETLGYGRAHVVFVGLSLPLRVLSRYESFLHNSEKVLEKFLSSSSQIDAMEIGMGIDYASVLQTPHAEWEAMEDTSSIHTLYDWWVEVELSPRGREDEGGWTHSVPMPPQDALDRVFSVPNPSPEFLHTVSCTFYPKVLKIEELLDKGNIPLPLGDVFPCSRSLLVHFSIIELCRMSSLAQGWRHLQISEERYSSEARLLFVFFLPIYATPYIFFTLKSELARSLHPLSDYYLPHNAAQAFGISAYSTTILAKK